MMRNPFSIFAVSVVLTVGVLLGAGALASSPVANPRATPSTTTIITNTPTYFDGGPLSSLAVTKLQGPLDAGTLTFYSHNSASTSGGDRRFIFDSANNSSSGASDLAVAFSIGGFEWTYLADDGDFTNVGETIAAGGLETGNVSCDLQTAALTCAGITYLAHPGTTAHTFNTDATVASGSNYLRLLNNNSVRWTVKGDGSLAIAGVSAGSPALTIPAGTKLTDGTRAITMGTSGLAFAGSFTVPFSALSANTTLNATHYYVSVDASGGAKTITLPTAASAAGLEYCVKKIDSSGNAVSVASTSSQTFDGASSPYSLAAQWNHQCFVSNGSNWLLY